MSTPAFAVYFGADAWEHTHWVGNVYPADLPADWRFDFYQTQYRCVELDSASWRALTLSEWGALAAAAHPGFRFMIDSTPAASRLLNVESKVDLAAVRALLRERLVFTSDVPVKSLIRLPLEPDCIDWKGLAQALQSATVQQPVFVIVPATALHLLERVEALIEVLGV